MAVTQEVQDLIDTVNELDTVIDGAEKTIGDLAAQVAAVAGNKQATLDLAAALKAKKSELAAAIANVPNEPPAAPV